MGKSLLYRLFGIGRIPIRERVAFEREGIVLVDEGVRGTVTFRHYRAPGKRFLWRKTGFAGSVALTKERFVGYAFSKHVVNVPLDHASLAKLEVVAERPSRLCVAFEASDFSENQSGQVECRWRTDQAGEFAEALNSDSHLLSSLSQGHNR